ncbi:tyrosine-protein phosphatase [Enterococcus dispar]|uniref:tyrosine-protein phosphatase n=1 Tax=Enterococcus dispar TaxID=44009 RepID=UPI00288DEA16|nr:CpsB/CapC family capsule biosynthesis tyrosine phosphatase [Enterococcus dispar]MDT2706171.1 tyrosine protein phosphatase [Enterococcus dispar]
MMDLHCHILPGIDDGAQNLKESLEMAKKAVDQGITHILCTPHHNQRYRNPRNEILQRVPQVQREFDQRDIPLTLFEGQEVRIHRNLIEEIKQNRILFTDVEDTYLLTEFPTREIPDYAEELLYELRTMGKVPIIVHPERNFGIQDEPNRLLGFLNMGCLAQLTAPSIVGVFGKTVQKLSKEFVQHGLVQMVASDAHSRKTRDFYLKEAYATIEKDFGKTVIEKMDQTCKDVINGDPVVLKGYTAIGS